MSAPTSPDLAQTARDIMQDKVVTIGASTPIADAVQTLEEHRISGAPVVDETSGQVIGVLSAFDIARRDRVEGPAGRHGYYNLGLLHDTAGWMDEVEEPIWEDYDEEALGRVTAREWMNPEVIFVAPETPIPDICRLMVEERIHRVLVLDGEKLLGLLTTLDIVRLLAERE